MFNVTEMFQPYVDQVRPMAQSAAEEMRAWGHRALARLDYIGEVLEQGLDNYEDRRLHLTDRTHNGAIASGASPLFTVPPGEVWELETVVLKGTAAGANVQLTELTTNPVDAGTGPVPWWGAPCAVGATSYDGNGVIFPAGVSIYPVCVGAIVDVRVQIKRILPRIHPRRGPMPGLASGDANGSSQVERPLPGAHTGMPVPIR